MSSVIAEEHECIQSENPNKPTLLKTDLRLGLPGSDSPERDRASGFGKDEGTTLKGFVAAGAKRGFCHGSQKWSLSMHAGSHPHLGKTEPLFSNGVNENVAVDDNNKSGNANSAPASKAQVVGWPPIRSFRKNTIATNIPKNIDVATRSGSNCLYVKVSMDGAPYLRKIDLKTYRCYAELSSALENMFSCFTIGQYGQEQLSESHLMDLLHGSEYVLTYEDKDGDWMLVGDVPWEMFTDSCKRLRIMKGSDAIGLAPRTMQKCRSQN